MESFYYDHNEDQELVKKPLSASVLRYLQDVIDPQFAVISEEDYWRNHAKWMMTAVRSSYFMHGGAAHWALEMEPFAVLRFTNGTVEVVEVPKLDSDEVDDDPQYDMIFDSWDDVMEGETNNWTACTEEDGEVIADCMDWTNDLHTRMHEKIPLESLFETGDEDSDDESE